MILAAAAAAAVTGVAVPPAQAAPAPPALRLLVGSNEVTLTQYMNYPGVDLDLGVHLAAERSPFEVRLKRASYRHRIEATQLIRQGGRVHERKLPRGLVKDFAGFAGMFRVVLKDARGRKVVDRLENFCPNGVSGRIRPEAPARSPYPEGCPTNPFTMGAVWGINRGWATNTFWWGQGTKPVKLPDGKYTAQIWVTKRYRDLFGIAADAKTVKVTIKTEHDGHGGPGRPALGPVARPNPAPPTGAQSVPPGPKPDLRSLPAFDIEIQRIRPKPGKPKRDFLAFAANVWNAGPSPMVVDGFRKPDKALMDAYQYFYDANGKQVGYTRTGTFEWDPRKGHLHWHFTDFAGYSLLDASKQQIVRSQKEAFCLANTDAVDLTVKNAKWQPGNRDLHTSCGEQSSLSLREVLDVGSGDTYVQTLPGQSFDVTGLPNGTYYIKVAANPAGRLYESSKRNNVALRKVVLGGRPGARTVKAMPVGLVNAP